MARNIDSNIVLVQGRNNAESLRASGENLLNKRLYKEANEQYRLAFVYSPRLFPEVILDYERLFEQEPLNTAARLSLAELYLSINDIDSAIIELEEVLDIDPQAGGVYSILGGIYLKRDEIDQAIYLLETAAFSGIKETSLTEMLAGAYLEKGDIEKAIALYEEILGKGEKSKNTLRILGDLYTRLGKNDIAADRYLLLLKENGELIDEVIHKLEVLKGKSKSDIHVREVLVEVYSRNLKPELAVAELKEILRSDMTKADFVINWLKKMLKIYPSQKDIIIALAEAATSKGAYSEAVSEYTRLLEFGDEYVDQAIAGYKDIIKRYPEQVLAHRFLGEAYLKKGMIDEALKEFRRNYELDSEDADFVVKKCREIFKYHPGNILSHEIIGNIYFDKRDYRRAIIHGEEIISVDKNYAGAYVLLAKSYLGLRDYKQAAETYRTAISLDPYNINIHNDYKKAKIGEENEEIEKIKRRISEDPWKVSNRLDLAKVYMGRGLYDETIKELQLVLKDQSRQAFTYNLLGLCFRAQGRYDMATTQFAKSLEALPSELSDLFKAIGFNLGATYEMAGMITEAISVYESVMQRDIDFGGLKQRILYLSSSHPRSLRNKMLIGVISNIREKDLIGMWARDGRKVDGEEDRELLNLSFSQSHNQKGFDFYLKGMYKGALEEFSLAEKLDEKLSSAVNNHGLVLLKEGKVGIAESKILRAIDEDSRSAALYNNLGIIKYLKGDLKMAELNFRRAVALDHALNPVYINLGDILYLLGNAKQAISCWERIKDFDPVSDFAKRRLMYMAV